MKNTKDSRANRLCFLILIISFVMIFVFNVATPMMTDDYTYGAQVREASGLVDLIKQEQHQYNNWSGRSVVHLLLRISLALPNILFKLVNSLLFLLLSIIIMLNVKGPRKWSPVFLAMATLALWTSAVSFCQTILWQTGAANYLWGTVIILSFMTFLRFETDRFLAKNGKESTFSAAVFEVDKNSSKKSLQDAAPTGVKVVAFSVLTLILGIPAGWCNENTSGGCLVFVLFLIFYCFVKTHRAPAFLWTGAAGTCFGLLMMVRAPGNAIRAAAQEEEHSGLYGLISRFQKATLAIGEEFPWLLALLILTIVITVAQYRGASVKALVTRLQNRLVFAVLWLITSYALILTAEPQRRAYFGAGIFLIIAVLQGIRDNIADERAAEKIWKNTVLRKKPDLIEKNAESTGAEAGITEACVEAEQGAGVLPIGGMIVRVGYTFLFLFVMLRFFFVFVDAGADNLRVYRDSKERVNYILEEKAAGNSECIVVPQLHPDFENLYTEAYDSELTEDPGYWTNVGYEQYFGVNEIIAIPYDEWKEQYKQN